MGAGKLPLLPNYISRIAWKGFESRSFSFLRKPFVLDLLPEKKQKEGLSLMSTVAPSREDGSNLAMALSIQAVKPLLLHSTEGILNNEIFHL